MKPRKPDIHLRLPYLFSDENFAFDSPKEFDYIEKFAQRGGKIKIDTGELEIIRENDALKTLDDDSPLLSPEQSAAFEAAYAENHETIKGWLLKNKKGLVNNIQDAENVMQSLWLYVLRKYKVSDMGVKAMLYKKAGLLAIDYARKRDRKNESLFSEMSREGDNGDEGFSPDNIVSENSNPFEFRPEDFWADYPDIDLSSEQKEVVWLYGHEGMTFTEIEKKTGVKKSTACDWIKKSRELFKASMEAVAG